MVKLQWETSLNKQVADQRLLELMLHTVYYNYSIYKRKDYIVIIVLDYLTLCFFYKI